MGSAGVVLAGGRSSRMGTPKAALEWYGSTLLRRTVAILARATGGPVVAELAHALKFGGKVVSYAFVSGVPPTVSILDMVFNEVAHTGFWVINWLRDAPRAEVEATYRELVDLIEQGHEIAPGTIEAVTGALDKHESPAEILEDVVWQHRNTRIAPKTVNQKAYVDSIRRHTITFGIGPAGTGKTFLAVAMAAASLSRGDVSRVILTRPAVEAGERLGFLPGDIQAKVDPYLRPLFDALYDLLDPERVNS